MLPRSESAESLSSLFSNRNSKGPQPLASQQQPKEVATGPTSTAGAAGQQSGPGSSFREQEERIQLKSLVIQRELSETSCIAYAFCLEKPRKLRLAICVNENSQSAAGEKDRGTEKYQEILNDNLKRL